MLSIFAVFYKKKGQIEFTLPKWLEFLYGRQGVKTLNYISVKYFEMTREVFFSNNLNMSFEILHRIFLQNYYAIKM